jgi:hypothetical protein
MWTTTAVLLEKGVSEYGGFLSVVLADVKAKSAPESKKSVT